MVAIEGGTMTHHQLLAMRKLPSCIRFARECNQDYLETKDKRFKQIRNEAMQDARYWRAVLLNVPYHYPEN